MKSSSHIDLTRSIYTSVRSKNKAKDKDRVSLLPKIHQLPKHLKYNYIFPKIQWIYIYIYILTSHYEQTKLVNKTTFVFKKG